MIFLIIGFTCNNVAAVNIVWKWIKLWLTDYPFASLAIYLQDGRAYAYLLNVLAPEHCSPSTLDAKDPIERAKLVLDHAERMGCKRYLTPKDIVDGSSNLNLGFVAQIFHHRFEINSTIHSLMKCSIDVTAWVMGVHWLLHIVIHQESEHFSDWFF